MTGYRVDPLTGDVAYIVADRQDRPNLPATGCPFCPGGVEAPEPYDVRWFPNRWPAIDDERCEVVLYTPDHDATFTSLGLAGARRVVDLWAERTAALGARPDVDYVLVFENRGPEVGATIAHPHGQIYGFDAVPPRALSELERRRRHRPPSAPTPPATAWSRTMEPGGRGCPGRRHGPTSCCWPPTRPSPTSRRSTTRAVTTLAATLVDVLGRLDRLFDGPMPYMMWFHQRPTDGGDWPGAWLHLHVAPLYRAPHTPRFVAAGELGSQVFFNPVDPVGGGRGPRVDA